MSPEQPQRPPTFPYDTLDSARFDSTLARRLQVECFDNNLKRKCSCHPHHAPTSVHAVNVSPEVEAVLLLWAYIFSAEQHEEGSNSEISAAFLHAVQSNIYNSR